jgi:N-acetylglucosaminyldiphosphoundecaprenol N-acetyl-beta-D-mannosaminyltransferase
MAATKPRSPANSNPGTSRRDDQFYRRQYQAGSHCPAEPHLWRRYWNDGLVLLPLFITCVLPLAVRGRWQWLTARGHQELVVEHAQDDEAFTVSLSGAAIARNVDKSVALFRTALVAKKKIIINLSSTHVMDARFLGLLLMLRKQADKQRSTLSFSGVSSRVRSTFQLNGAGFLLNSDRSR